MTLTTGKGFSLIELLVVITIITILSTIGVVTYSNAQKSARDAIKKAAVDTISKAFETKYIGGSSYGDLTPTNNANLFNSNLFPTPPEGGEYTILQNTDTSGFIVCASLGNNPPCSALSDVCFCRSSIQAAPPVVGAANVTYVTTTPLITSTPSTNILVNGSFENQLSRWSEAGALEGNISVDDSIKHLGNYAAKVVNIGGYWGWQIGQSGFEVNSGDQFCLSAWVKKQGSDDTVSIALQDSSSPRKEQDLWAETGTSWQQVKGTVIVGNDWVRPIQVFLREWYPGTVWFDEVSLTRGPC